LGRTVSADGITAFNQAALFAARHLPNVPELPTFAAACEFAHQMHDSCIKRDTIRVRLCCSDYAAARGMTLLA
jgi:hypothetical protein